MVALQGEWHAWNSNSVVIYHINFRILNVCNYISHEEQKFKLHGIHIFASKARKAITPLLRNLLP